MMESLMNGQKANMIFTDPPYGVDYVSLSNSYKSNPSGNRLSDKKWDNIYNDELRGVPLKDFCKKFLSRIIDFSHDIHSLYICFAAKNIQHLLSAMDDLDIKYSVPIIWYKNSANLSWNRYHPDYEIIIYGGSACVPTGKNSVWYGPNNETTHWNIDRDSSNTYLHPTQKPVELAVRALKNSSKEGDIILDSFCGSGFVLLACEQMNRKAYVIDMSPLYVQTVIERWEKFTGKKSLKVE